MVQAKFCFDTHVGLHAKVPLISLLGLVHLGVTLALVVLGRTGRRNQRGIHHSAGPEHQATINELGIHSGQNLLAQPMLFEQVAKTQEVVFRLTLNMAS